MPETSAQKVITPVVITCTGTVSSKPRLVRRRERQTPYVECEFVFKFRYDVQSGDTIPSVDSELIVRHYENRVLSLLSVEGIYTDSDGVIRHFEQPTNRIWWVEIRAISTKTLKPIPLALPEPPEGPTIEGEVVSTEAVQD